MSNTEARSKSPNPSSNQQAAQAPRRLLAALLVACAASPLVACSRSEPPAQSPTADAANASRVSRDEQAIVERSAAAFKQLRENPRFARADFILERARGVMIFPRLVKASLVFGGEGGNGVLVARNADGSWSDPAFYSIGAPSVGLQVGYQQATVALFIMDQPTLERALHSSFELGTKAGATLGYVDDNGTTKAHVVSANVYQLVDADGVFAGVSLDGYVIGSRARHNSDYYGRPATPRQILLEGAVHQPGAAVLERALAPRGDWPKLATVTP